MVTTERSSPTRSDPTPGPRVPTPRRSKWRAGSSSRLVLESALIVLSVLLGFALSEWRARQAERERAAVALENFRQEINENLAEMERVYPMHVRFVERLAGAIESGADEWETGFDAFAALMPEGGIGSHSMREAAWETAVSTGALRLLDYEAATLLSETYLVQAKLALTRQIMGDRFSDESNFDPQRRNTMIRVHHRLMSDLAGQEEYLIDAYRRTLQGLPAPARP